MLLPGDYGVAELLEEPCKEIFKLLYIGKPWGNPENAPINYTDSSEQSVSLWQACVN